MILEKLPNLIGIHGHARAGKDTVKDFLISTYSDHYSISFADPLKEAASVAFGIPLEWFYQDSLKEIDHPNWSTSPRKIAQFMGTEMFRDTIHKLVPSVGDDFWVTRLALRITNRYVPEGEGHFDTDDTVVIPDVRFQNEYDWIIENGGIIIHLTRPGADGNIGIPGHASESSLNLHNIERTYECVNDSTLPSLYKKIADIIISLKY
jgi:hypothetical protein